MYRVIFTAASLATLAFARTDLTGCTSTDVSSPAGASLAWYVPGTGELCDFLDCGGGRAPPKYDVPGCPQYTGTETYSPSYMAGWGSATAAPASASSAWAAHSSAWGYGDSTWAETTATPTAWESSSWSSSNSWSSSESSAAPVSSSWSSSWSSSSAWSTSAAAIVPSGWSSTVAPTANGTLATSSPTPSAPYQANGAGAERVWYGGAAIAALGAAVAAL